jgi:hypothetical protein
MFLLGAFIITSTMLYSIAAAVAIGACVALIYNRWDSRREERRDAAIDVANFLKDKIGCVFLPALMRAYAVGNYSKVAAKLADAAEILVNPERVEEEVDRIRKNVLKAALQDPVTREKLMKFIAENDPVKAVPTSAYVPPPIEVINTVAPVLPPTEIPAV